MVSTSVSPTQQSGIDERHQQRWQLVNYLRLYNADDSQLLGHLVNITTEGIMLISETPLPTDTVFNLKMDLPSNQGNTQTISLNAHTVWTKPDVDPYFHCTGLQLLDCPEESINALASMITKLQSLQKA